MPAKVVLAGLFCAIAAAVAVAWLTGTDPRGLFGPRPPLGGPAAVADPAPATGAGVPEPDAADLATPFVDERELDDAGLGIAAQFTPSIRDPGSLDEIREVVEARGPLALAALEANYSQLGLGPDAPRDQAARGASLQQKIGMLLMYEGRTKEAEAAFGQALTLIQQAGGPARARADLHALQGIAALRRGEVDNCIECLGPTSCIFPIAPEAAHTRPDGSRAAAAHFVAALAEAPGDLRIRWLLNLAHMTLGDYPDKVPAQHRLALDRFQPAVDLGRFRNVAPLIGLTGRGPGLAGGSVFDDFNGDHRPDLFATGLDVDRGASMFVNNGDGTFDDRSSAAGLDDQVYVLNLARADYDNDGDLDVLLLRGGWDRAMRMSLLKNKGDGTFDDATLAAGLGTPIASEAAAFGDYDNDGHVDLFVCGEYVYRAGGTAATPPDPRNRCRLYHNNGDGTFTDVAESAGVAEGEYSKGCAWGDYDADGKLDLFVSNMSSPSRLYHNDGGGKFTDLAPKLGVARGHRSFACWFWDFDNDGKLDLYVNDYSTASGESAGIAFGAPLANPSLPHLYRNLGAEGFRDVAAEVGLGRDMSPMGSNFGDVDNDGFLDLYQGTGVMSFGSIVPNLLLKNAGGKLFADATLNSGTGHLQKGHGIAFADRDADGDLDFFVVAGGGVPGDKAYNVLFDNPGHGRPWLDVKLVGTKTNRSAIGAKIQANVAGPDGTSRSIYRTIGNNSSFGGNTLVEHLGLGDGGRVTELTITWPTSGTEQTFRDLPANRTIVVTEGAEAFETLDLPAAPAPPPAAAEGATR